MVKGMKPIFQEHECLSEGTINENLGNRLYREERFQAENHLLDCPLCSDAVDGYALLKTDSQASRPRIINWRLFAIAAALLVLLAAAVWIYSGPATQDNLFAQYFESYDSDLEIQFRDSGVTDLAVNTPLARGLKAYGEKDYSAAIAGMETSLKDNPEHAVARFYLGLSQMEEALWDDAEQNFLLVQKARLDYWEEATWYLALIYVKNDRPAEAKHALDALIGPGNGRYYEKAKELSSKL